MADETVDIDVNVNGADEAAGKFTRLQVQIRETQKALQAAEESGDKLKFNQLKGQLDELEDKLEITQLKSKQFDDTLAALPGPAGKAGQAIKGLDGVFKLIAANPIVAAIAGLSALFLALRESLSRTEEGTKALSRITEGFERILNALFAVLEPIAFAFADLIGSLLENKTVMTGLGKVVAVLGGTFSALFSTVKALGEFVVGNFINAFKSLTGVLGGVGKVLKGVFTFDLDAIKEGVDQVKNTVVTGFTTAVDNTKKLANGIVTAVTDDFMKGFDAAETSFTEGSKRLTKKEREEKKKRDEQAAKDAVEAAKKLADARKEAEAVLLEAELSLLEERQRKLKERELKFNEDKAKLIAAGITDFTTLEKAYREDVLDINKEFDDKEAEERKKKDEERKKELLKQQEDERGIRLNGLQAEFEELDRKNKQSELDFAQDLERLARQREILADQERTELENSELTEFEKTQIRKKYADARREITDNEIATEKAAMQAKHEINMAYLGLFSQFGGLLQQIAGKNKALAIAGVIIQQAASIGQIIANTGIANAKALAASPLTFGQPWVAINTISAGLSIAATIASAAKSIQQINQAAAQAGVQGGGGGSVGAAPTLNLGGGPRVGAPQIGATAAQSGTIAGIVAGTLQQNQSQGQPIRAYVVGNEITTQQQLDRRIRTAARLGG